MRVYDVIVVGAGLIGSAAAKYLSRAGASVALVGPGEPGNYADSEVFASHYDEGRIVRSLDKDEYWSTLAQASLPRFEEIESESGIRFHTTSGFLHAGFPPGHSGDSLSSVMRMSAEFDIPLTRLDFSALQSEFPFFSFEPGCEGLLEAGLAGFINPRALVSAQQAVFARHGGVLVRDVVRQIRSKPDHFELLGSAADYAARKVLVSAGAWTHLMRLTPRGLPLDVRPETIILIPIGDDEAADLVRMPSLWYTFSWHPVLPYIYLVPPIRFPDGRRYIKVGSDNDRDIICGTEEEAAAYFRSAGSSTTREHLLELVERLLPRFGRREVVSKPCILTYTADRRPIVEEMETGWFVATAGNGAGAKSSDEIGRLGSALVLG